MEENKEKPTEALTKEEEYLDGWKRAKAELINYKKDELKRFEEIIKFANEGIVGDLLAVLDSFTLATAVSHSEQGEESTRGLSLIQSQLENLLKKHGLEKLLVNIGDSFNPALHEAVVAVESGQPPDTIVEIVEAGYKLYDKIIRPTKVKVTK
ncbi:MAG: nucleotide exchange factor GrpE [Patescibacteria group bacterium]